MMTVVPLRRPEGGVVIAHRDITESRQAEMTVQRHQQELAHVARVTLVGELTASLAHEINHPLASIMSNAQAAQHFSVAEMVRLAERIRLHADDPSPS